jgi:CRISPR-associated protein Csm2
MAARYQLSTAYIYGLLSLADMRQQMDTDPTKARWRSYLAYRTWRMVKGDRGGGGGPPRTPADFSAIKLENPAPELFDSVAESTAKKIAESAGGAPRNKSTQLRRFYDEIVMWDQRLRQSPDQYAKFLPLIKMINAKATYAEARQLVDRDYVDLMKHCTGQLSVDKPEVFHHLKLFMEAFMGFYKLYGPK